MIVYIQESKIDLQNKLCSYSILSKNENVEIKFLTDSDNDIEKFSIPNLEDYKGWVLYCSGNLLFNVNIGLLFSFIDEQYAIMKVEEDKDNSLMLWNCSHPNNQKLSKDRLVSMSEEQLNNFIWLKPNMIGHLDNVWNWVPGKYKLGDKGQPRIINFTNQNPSEKENTGVEYGIVWERLKNEYLNSIAPTVPVNPYDFIPPDIESIFNKILHYRVDPAQEYYNDGNLEEIIKDLKMINNDKVYAVDGGWNPDEKKGLVYDPYMESFILGSGGQITNYDKVEQSMVPVLFRGITKMKHMKACEAIGRDYYYIDTGYFGNARKKLYHRITKNAMQNIGPVIERPFDRLEATGWRRKKFRPGKNILICPPSAKAMSCFGQDLDQWMEETIKTIEQYTDRPIVIRKKLSRRERGTTDTMEMALEQDVHCLVTFNSIAATEALLYGKPAFTLGPNAAHSLSLQDLSLIEKPYIPTVDELEAWAAHLAYCQFTELEMRDGTAWKILNDH